MRADKSLVEKDIYQFGDFRLDAAKRVLEKAGKPVSLTPKALDVLIALVKNRGQLVEKDELMRTVWQGTFVEENNLAFNVSVLRKLLGDNSATPQFIETVPKRGYRFIAEVREIAGDGTPLATSVPNGRMDATRVYTTQTLVASEQLEKRARRTGPLVVFAVVVFGAAAALFIYQSSKAPKLTARDTLVLADFENKTGDPIFDGTLRDGFAIELQQSPFISLVSEQQIRHALRLMSQPADAPLRPGLAREVCQRVGGAAVLEGSIAQLGSEYVITMRAKLCASGDVLDDEQTEVKSKEQLLDAVTGLARHMRSRIGESAASLKAHDTPLIEATTAQLEALKAYSESIKVGYAHGCPASIPFDLRAVELDPQFAMALSHLGRCYSNVGETSLAAENTAKAYQLRGRVSDREKFYITLNYDRQVLGNLLKAQQVGELWAGTYPRDAVAYGSLAGTVYQGAGKYEESIQAAEKALFLDPDMAPAYANLGFANLYLDRPGQAADALKRATERKLDTPDLLLVRYYAAFLRNDPAEMRLAAARAAGRTGAEDALANSEALFLARSGQFVRAGQMSRRAEDLARNAGQQERAATYEAGEAVRNALVGNKSKAKEIARHALTLSDGRDLEYGAAFALLQAGDGTRAQALANDLRKRFPEDTFVQFTYLPVLDGLLALNEGDPAKAIEKLQVAARDELAMPGIDLFAFFGGLYPAYVRGQAYLALGQGQAAAAEFQKLVDHRGIVLADPAGALARLQLARALAMAGDRAKARIVYQDFLDLWKNADSDIPVLAQAKGEYRKLWLDRGKDW